MSKLNILSLSDIHLGHKRTHTEYIVNNLNKYISNDETLSNIDLLFLVGDVFDTQLNLSSPDVSIIDYWVAKLLRLCNKHKVCVRVLEGTPSHDRGQSERFTVIHDILKKNKDYNVDLKYIDTLAIENIERFNINILYIPDEWNTSTDQTYSEVQELLQSKGLKQVDYALVHGTFMHQLPSHVKNIPRHDNSLYSNIVKNIVFVGHIHQHSISGKIVSHGSFDRLSHGEEEAKGFVKVFVEKDNHHEVKFIENKHAKKYITIDTFESDIDLAISRIDDVVKELPEESNVRIRCNKDSNISSSLPVLKTRWPLLIWSITTIEEKDDSIMLIDDKPVYVPLIINKNNIADLVTNRLIKAGVDKDTLELCSEILKEVL